MAGGICRLVCVPREVQASPAVSCVSLWKREISFVVGPTSTRCRVNVSRSPPPCYLISGYGVLHRGISIGDMTSLELGSLVTNCGGKLYAWPLRPSLLGRSAAISGMLIIQHGARARGGESHAVPPPDGELGRGLKGVRRFSNKGREFAPPPTTVKRQATYAKRV